MLFINYIGPDGLVTCSDKLRVPLPGDILKIKPNGTHDQHAPFITARISKIDASSISWITGTSGVLWSGPGDVSFNGGSQDTCSKYKIIRHPDNIDTALFWTKAENQDVKGSCVCHTVQVPVWTLDYPNINTATANHNCSDALIDVSYKHPVTGRKIVIQRPFGEIHPCLSNATTDRSTRKQRAFFEYVRAVLNDIALSHQKQCVVTMNALFQLIIYSYNKNQSPAEASSQVTLQFNSLTIPSFEDYIDRVAIYNETLGDSFTEGTFFNELRRLIHAHQTDLPPSDFRFNSHEQEKHYTHLSDRLHRSDLLESTSTQQ